MHWEPRHRRAAGFTVEILRHTWVLGLMFALTSAPCQTPADIRRRLSRANMRDAPLVGYRGLSHDTASKGLRDLTAQRLALRCDPDLHRGAMATYEITRLGGGMLASLDAVSRFGLAHWGHVVADYRRRHGVHHGAHVPAPGTGARRAATGMALDMLGYRWAFPLLAILTDGPGTAPELADRITIGMRRFDDLSRRRMIPMSSVYDVLGQLEASGLVANVGTVYGASPLGWELLAALWQVALWGLPWDAELWLAMSSRPGWPADVAPLRSRC